MRESYAIRVYKQYFNFGSAHFLIFADGTREELHGHNYQVQVKLEGAVIEGDLVVDFIPFKPVVKALCDELDHVHVAQPAWREDATRVHVCGERIVEDGLQPANRRLAARPRPGRRLFPSL